MTDQRTTVGGGGIVRACCVPANYVDALEVGAETTRYRCRVCGRRHFVGQSRPGHIGVRGSTATDAPWTPCVVCHEVHHLGPCPVVLRR